MDFKEYMNEYDMDDEDVMDIIDLEDDSDPIYVDIVTEFGDEVRVKVADNRMELFEVAMMVESYERTKDESILDSYFEYLSLEEKKLRILGYKALENSLDKGIQRNRVKSSNKTKKSKRKIAKKSKIKK